MYKPLLDKTTETLAMGVHANMEYRSMYRGPWVEVHETSKKHYRNVAIALRRTIVLEETIVELVTKKDLRDHKPYRPFELRRRLRTFERDEIDRALQRLIDCGRITLTGQRLRVGIA